MSAHVFFDGSVYSPADPFATALVMDRGLIEWVGQDAGARSILDPTMGSTELAGQLVTPSFALGAVAVAHKDAPALLSRLQGRGYSVANLFLTDLTEGPTEYEGVEPRFYVAAGRVELSAAKSVLGGSLAGVYVTDPAQLTDTLLGELGSGRLNLSIIPADQQAAEAALQRLKELEPLTRVRISPRLDGLKGLNESNLTTAINLQVSLGFSSDYTGSGQAYGQALAAGASVMLGSDPLSAEPTHLGWELINAAVNTPEQLAVSARGAFQSMTRAVYRAGGAANPLAGQLVPGAPAHLAIWSITELMVQTPDSRISAWSTDPRARTPLLPVLSGDVPRPQLTALYRSGSALT